MARVNRSAFFNTGLQFVGGKGRTHKVMRTRAGKAVGPYGPFVAGNYVMRGWDSGLAQWVEWGPFTFPLLTPTATQTRPNFTGTLSLVMILTGP